MEKNISGNDIQYEIYMTAAVKSHVFKDGHIKLHQSCIVTPGNVHYIYEL